MSYMMIVGVAVTDLGERNAHSIRKGGSEEKQLRVLGVVECRQL